MRSTHTKTGVALGIRNLGQLAGAVSEARKRAVEFGLIGGGG